jgi:hypothetical protein
MKIHILHNQIPLSDYSNDVVIIIPDSDTVELVFNEKFWQFLNGQIFIYGHYFSGHYLLFFIARFFS